MIFIAIIGIILFWIILFDTSRFVIVKHKVADERIRGSLRACVLADLHNKQYGKENELLLKAIEEQKPDVIFIAGDILTAQPGKSLKPAICFMEKLAEKCRGQGVALTWDEAAVEALVSDGLDPALGARPLRQRVERLVEDPLAAAILVGQTSGAVHLTLREGQVSLLWQEPAAV